MYLGTITLVHLFANQHCCSTFTNISIIDTQPSNLTHTVSYGTYETHVVIYIPILAINEDTALSLGLCDANDFISIS